MDRYKILGDLLIYNETPHSFVRNGVFVSQSIFSSSIVIRDGNYSNAFFKF
jgi:hypothetical protein